jgi:hypothetical protein
MEEAPPAKKKQLLKHTQKPSKARTADVTCNKGGSCCTKDSFDSIVVDRAKQDGKRGGCVYSYESMTTVGSAVKCESNECSFTCNGDCEVIEGKQPTSNPTPAPPTTSPSQQPTPTPTNAPTPAPTTTAPSQQPILAPASNPTPASTSTAPYQQPPAPTTTAPYQQPTPRNKRPDSRAISTAYTSANKQPQPCSDDYSAISSA